VCASAIKKTLEVEKTLYKKKKKTPKKTKTKITHLVLPQIYGSENLEV
jgi:hypothetical protein